MWSTELASLINSNNSNNNNFNFMIAKVLSTSPLIIEVGGQAISKFIYINKSLTILADDFIDKVKEAFDDDLKVSGSTSCSNCPSNISATYTSFSSNWFDFLCEFHQNLVLKKDDTVVVMQISTSFYILEKVEVVA